MLLLFSSESSDSNLRKRERKEREKEERRLAREERRRAREDEKSAREHERRAREEERRAQEHEKKARDLEKGKNPDDEVDHYDEPDVVRDSVAKDTIPEEDFSSRGLSDDDKAY